MKQFHDREQALEALYAADTQRLDEIDTDGLSQRASDLACGVWVRRRQIDHIITQSASHWRIERMAVVDRNLIRLGVYELKVLLVPVGIVIDEAVELAKVFSTAESPKFVNGVLNDVAQSDLSAPDPDPNPDPETEPESDSDSDLERDAREPETEDSLTDGPMVESEPTTDL